jgi:hypothetical protein
MQCASHFSFVYHIPISFLFKLKSRRQNYLAIKRNVRKMSRIGEWENHVRRTSSSLLIYRAKDVASKS